MRSDKKNDDRRACSVLETGVFCAGASLHERMRKLKDNVVLRMKGYHRAKASDEAAFERIAKLLPEIRHYEKSTQMDLLRRRALLSGFRDLEDYHEGLLTDAKELAELRENLTLMGSHFFRGTVWPELEKICRERLSGKDKVRVWCAGCSNGKEVYSILMTLLELMPSERIELLATDYNCEALKRCREGSYPLRTLKEIPGRHRGYVSVYRASAAEDYAYRYQFRFRDSIRRMISTERLDLLKDAYPGGFDFILCRNVIKFFDPAVRVKIQQRLAESLGKDAFLVLSEEEAETIAHPEEMGLERHNDTCIYLKK